MNLDITEEKFDSRENGYTTDIIDPSDGWKIATVYTTDRERGLANLRLLLSAPEMYEILEEMRDCLDSGVTCAIQPTSYTADKIRCAIAKAKGENQ